ncbi:MAG: hydroxyquinol 1,2-dioxygenase [Phenylobacterium sp.]|nr:hydroxyquinol 1,2-dioxygenase [Phenylobacterium sp.]
MSDDQRLAAIYLRAVGMAKELVREFSITEDELHAAGRYFNRLGVSGMFLSLLDVNLALAAVAANSPGLGGTRQNLEGPYHAAHPLRPDGVLLTRPPGDGAPRLTLSGLVTDARTGKPLPGAILDFWQADAEGIYDRKGDHLRGKVAADAEGRYRIRTVVPDDYAEHDGDPIGELFRAMGKPNTRAAHIHVKAEVGGTVVLTTQLFMPTSKFLDRDYVEGSVSPDLVLTLEPHGEAFTARFDFALLTPQGAPA